MMKKLFVFINLWRFVPHWLYYHFSLEKTVITSDIQRNIKLFLGKDGITFFSFCTLLLHFKMVRNIFYARVANRHRTLMKFMVLLVKPQPLLDISPSAEIGGGLIVQHGYGTIIDPRKMGKNCWVNQGVTIGYTNDTDCPTLGDNVTVYCGAKILGNVHIGNNVIVAANAVVVKDVPDNCVVGGVPAKILKRL